MAGDRRRRSIRLRGHDYAATGAYFVTICTHQRECLFGNLHDGQVHRSDLADIVHGCWNEIPGHNAGVDVDAFVVMPNHVHGVIVIGTRRGDACVAPTTGNAKRRPAGPVRGSVGAIVGSFKSAAARNINAQRGTPGAAVWQRGYHEHIVRDEDELGRIRRYIADNPARWAADAENPANAGLATLREQQADAATLDAANLKELGCAVGRTSPRAWTAIPSRWRCT